MHKFKLQRGRKLSKDVLSRGNNMSKIKEAWNSMGHGKNAKHLGDSSVRWGWGESKDEAGALDTGRVTKGLVCHTEDLGWLQLCCVKGTLKRF